MADDDTVAAKLPRLNVPGVQTPPPQPPGLDPMEGLKNMARDAANAVAPVMTLGGDATRIGNELKTTGGMVADKVLGGIFGDQYQRERTNPAAGVDPFAYKGAPIPAPPTPGATPAPAAPNIAPPPPAAAPVAGAPAPAAPGGDKFDKQVQLASLISAQNNSRTPVSNPYEGPAAGVAPPAGGVHGSIGVEGFQKQLANIQALRTSEPQPGGGAAADTETWQDKQNRQMGEKWAQEDQMRMLKSINPNTAGGRAQLAAVGHLISSGQSAAASRYGADASSGASMHNAQLGYQGGRERDAANLQATGMQVSGQDRNSQRVADASMYGHSTHARTAMQDAMLRAQTAMQGHQVQRDTNAATNASALERTRMMVDEGRERTAAGAKESQNKLLMAGNEKLVNPLNPAEWYTRSGEKGRFVEVGMPKPKDKKAEK